MSPSSHIDDLNIVMAASEAVPYAKTGGLADVAGALPLELLKLGHRVTLVIPHYGHFFETGLWKSGSPMLFANGLRCAVQHADYPGDEWLPRDADPAAAGTIRPGR